MRSKFDGDKDEEGVLDGSFVEIDDGGVVMIVGVIVDVTVTVGVSVLVSVSVS